MGLGALVSPLIADPFLSETSCVIGNSSTNSTSLTHLRNKLAGRQVHNVSSVHLHTDGDVVTNVSYAFWIMAITNVRAFLLDLVLQEWRAIRTHAGLVDVWSLSALMSKEGQLGGYLNKRNESLIVSLATVLHLTVLFTHWLSAY